MAFNWEQSAFLGYMVEQYEKEQQQQSYGWDDDEDEENEEEEEESHLPWWER